MGNIASLFDAKRVAQNRKRALPKFAEHDFLHRRVWQDLMDRKDIIQREFQNVCVQGGLFPTEADHQNTGAAPLDLLLSFLELHLVDDLPGALAKYRAQLKPDGVFLGALFGGQSLYELRRAFLAAEAELYNCATARIIPFVDVRTMGTLVQAAGFALPVIDVDTVVVRYTCLLDLLHDLRFMGEGNPMFGPIRPLSKELLARTEAQYKREFSDENGRLVARFDIVHICGWAPDDSQPKALRPGSAQMFLGDALKQS